MCVCMLSCFSRVWLCNPMDRNPSGSSVHEILQARVLEWLAMPFSMGSSSGSPALQASSPSEPLGKSLFSTASAKSNYWYHLTSDGWAVGIEKSFRKEQRWTRRNVNFTNLDPISSREVLQQFCTYDFEGFFFLKETPSNCSLGCTKPQQWDVLNSLEPSRNSLEKAMATHSSTFV